MFNQHKFQILLKKDGNLNLIQLKIMDNYLDYKATVWFRIPIRDKETLNKVKQKIEKGMLPSELYNDLDTERELGQCEILYDTEEFISPSENDGQSTIEIYSDGDKNTQMIWDNSYKSEIKRKNEN